MRTITRALGTLSAAAVLVAACGGGTPTTAPTGAAGTPAGSTPGAATTAPVATQAALCTDVTQEAPATQVEASVDDFTWSQPVAAKVGEVITWKNTDTAPHGVQTDDSGCKMNGSIAVNAARSLVFNEAGTFTFFCFVHPSMKGTITIT
jgi:plastocyanin